jgi:phenylalanyl-tRNA synthetase beta chain
MKISHQWLKTFVDVRLKPAQLAERLSMLGLEIESFEDQGARFDGFVVGKVLEKRKHPHADKLVVCLVDVGVQRLEIVCGAPNVEAGQNVVVAQVGATVLHDQHDPDGKPFVVQRIKIRGVESNGMICSPYELGVGNDRDGILVLKPNAKPGTPFAHYMGLTDVVYAIEITANRGDWLSHLGVAREVGALVGKKVRLPRIRVAESKRLTRSVSSVQVLEPQKCRRYSARVLRNVRIHPSPPWLQNLLTGIGIRPINNVVDVTNFVMAELGQPLHAFDFEKLVGRRIVVRCANEGESFTTLDGKTRTLQADMLMICDAQRPVAIAGIMGGANSEITETTTEVLLESANFDPTNVRKTARALGLSTDASQRFERGVDIELTTRALDRASQLLQEISAVEVLRGIIDVYPERVKPRKIKLRTSKANAILGTSLTTSQIASMLKRLELGVERQSADSLTLEIPTFRNDLSEEIDLIEEIARLYGYDKIETRTTSVVSYNTVPPQADFRDLLRQYCVGAGFNEIIANSLQDRRTASLAGETAVEVINPVSAEMSFLRPSLIPGVLHIIRNNQYRGTSSLRLFEVGRVYTLKAGGSTERWEDFVEEERLLLSLSGALNPRSYGVEYRQVDFFDLKGEVEALLAKFHLDKYRLISYDSDRALTSHNVSLEIEGTYAGFLGKVKKEILEKFEIEGEVFVGEFLVDVLEQKRRTIVTYHPLPKYPSVLRDVAFVVDRQVPGGEVEQAIRESGGDLLREVTLFDVYVGKQLGEEKKSFAFGVKFQAEDRTLTEQEVNDCMNRIIEHVRRKCGGILRG